MRCVVDVAPIRAAPSDQAEQVTQALLGEPLRTEEHRDGWVRVITVYDYPGWMREWAVDDGEGDLPQLIAGRPLPVARSYLGSRYEWGGLSKRGIDCSGLVHIAHRLSGRLVPRDARQQEAAAAEMPLGHELPGDLVTYGAGEQADHIAFWLGGGRILHATSRDGLGVVAEAEPAELQRQKRRVVRLETTGPFEGSTSSETRQALCLSQVGASPIVGDSTKEALLDRRYPLCGRRSTR